MTKWVHVGTQPIEAAGVIRLPGEEFDGDLSERQEAFFLQIGAIQKRSSQKAGSVLQLVRHKNAPSDVTEGEGNGDRS